MKSRKGLDMSLNVVISIILVVVALLILGFMQTEYASNLKSFGLSNIAGALTG